MSEHPMRAERERDRRPPVLDGQVRHLRSAEAALRRGERRGPRVHEPEGIVLYHGASGQLFKVTLEKDEEPKGKS